MSNSRHKYEQLAAGRFLGRDDMSICRWYATHKRRARIWLPATTVTVISSTVLDVEIMFM